MEILEFGDKNKRKIILIHGFQTPYQVLDRYIERYKNDFHVIVPIISGHSVSEKEDFVSFELCAQEFEKYYISRYGEKVYAIYGMSMGGVFAATLWRRGMLELQKIIFDGSPLVSVNGLIKKFMQSFYLNVTHRSQKRDKKTVDQAVGSIITEENIDHFLRLIDNMSDATVENCLSEVAKFKLPKDIAVEHTQIYFYHGTAMNEMLAKRTAKYLAKNYPDTVIKCFKGRTHCEISLFHPDVMIEEMDKILK